MEIITLLIGKGFAMLILNVSFHNLSNYFSWDSKPCTSSCNAENYALTSSCCFVSYISADSIFLNCSKGKKTACVQSSASFKTGF